MTTLIEITWHGCPRTKKNSGRILRRGSRYFIAPSEAFERYQCDCIRQTPGNLRQYITDMVNVQCVYYMPTHRRVDLLNLMAATLDILVKAGVLADDNCKIAAAHDGSRVRYDKNNPRVEITITPQR